MPIVCVVSQDWSLRVAVRAELRHAGVEALGLESLDDLTGALAQGRSPSAVVLDAGLIPETPAAQESLANLARRVPVVVVASRVEDSAAATPVLQVAAAVLYRPASVGEIVARVQQLLTGQAA